MNLFDLLFTKRCLCCDKIQPVTAADICPICTEKLYPTGGADAPIAPYFYEGSAAIMLRRLKYKKEKQIRDFFANEMVALLQSIPLPHIDFITHIPRYTSKEYCQAEYLAIKIAKGLDKPFISGLLTKKRKNKSQTKCKSILQRHENVAGVFTVNGIISSKSILLIDDIVTTGATLEEATKALYIAGAKEVISATAAKTPIARMNRLQVYRDFDCLNEDKTETVKKIAAKC